MCFSVSSLTQNAILYHNMMPCGIGLRTVCSPSGDDQLFVPLQKSALCGTISGAYAECTLTHTFFYRSEVFDDTTKQYTGSLFLIPALSPDARSYGLTGNTPPVYVIVTMQQTNFFMPFMNHDEVSMYFVNTTHAVPPCNWNTTRHTSRGLYHSHFAVLS